MDVMSLPQKLRVVLHQTQGADNLGAVARLCANFGVAELWLAETHLPDLEAARPMAVHAGHVLDAVNSVPTLPEALGDVVFAMGTTSRTSLRGMPTLSPEEAMAMLAEHARRGPVALVLGGERRGMSDEDLAHCQQALVIPTRPEQPSMNLAQAAAVLLYLASREGSSEAPAEAPKGAPLRLVQALDGWMQQVLLEVDFLNPRGPGPILAEMRHALTRSNLTEREAQLWLSAFKAMARRLVKPQVPPGTD